MIKKQLVVVLLILCSFMFMTITSCTPMRMYRPFEVLSYDEFSITFSKYEFFDDRTVFTLNVINGNQENEFLLNSYDHLEFQHTSSLIFDYDLYIDDVKTTSFENVQKCFEIKIVIYENLDEEGPFLFNICSIPFMYSNDTSYLNE